MKEENNTVEAMQQIQRESTAVGNCFIHFCPPECVVVLSYRQVSGLTGTKCLYSEMIMEFSKL